jgi:hypothetical protein
VKIRLLFFIVGNLLLTACDADESGNPSDYDCAVIAKRPIGWTEVGPFGKSPQSAFSEVAGTCQAPFKWNSGTNDTLLVEPALGDTTIDVSVTVDEGSAMVIERIGLMLCPSLLQVSAKVVLRSADGALNEERIATIVYTDTSKYDLIENPSISWNEKAEKLSGALSVTPKKGNTEVSLLFQIVPIGIDCAGQIGLSVITTTGKRGNGFDQLNFASWSTSKCEFGLREIELSKPYQGVLLAEEITEHFTEVTYPGAWNSGETTSLTLTAVPTASKVCVESRGNYSTVIIPIQTTYSTADGRATDLKADGTIRALLQEGGSLSNIELSSGKDADCRSFGNLEYWSIDCASVHSIEAELHMNYYFDNTSRSLGSLRLYPDVIPEKYLDSNGGYKGDPIPRLDY